MSATTRTAITAFLVSRLGLFALAWCSLIVAPTLWDPHAVAPCPEAQWLDGWARWDSGWYASVARNGYQFKPGEPCNVNFFPLYPLLAWLLAAPLRGVLAGDTAFYAAGWLLSHACFLLALLGLARLAEPLGGGLTARRAIWLLALFPFSFFFSAVYTEALFLALAVWAFVWAAADRWPAACACAALAAVTRMPGGILGLALGAQFLAQKQWRAPTGRRDTLALLAIPTLLGLLCLHHALRFGDPIVFVHTATSSNIWGRNVSPLHMVRAVRDIFGTHDPIERAKLISYLSATALMAAMAWRCLQQKRFGFAVFIAVSLLLGASTGSDALGRYWSVLFPGFIALAELLPTRRGFSAVVSLFVPLLAFFAVVFNHWGGIN